MTSTHFRAIELIVQGHPLEAIAEQIGVTTRTLCNWKKNKEFATELRDQLTHVRDQIQARFNPVIARIQKNTETFLDRLEKMLASADDKIALRAMQMHLQCLKWAGNSENRTRGSYIANDAIIGSARIGNMFKSLGLGSIAPQETEEEIGNGPLWSAGVSPTSKTGKDRKPEDPPALSAAAPAAPEAEETGNAPSATPPEECRRDAGGTAAPQPEEIGNEKSETPNGGTSATARTAGVSPAIPKRPKPAAAPAKWWEKGLKSSNHVPFYKRIRR